VVSTVYKYDENKMEKSVKINKTGHEHCDIVEIFTADVSATESIRENFNISKDAEDRKKELERDGYTTGLNQVNSSGYKTYKITASRTLPVKKMEVQRIDYRLMDEYCREFEEDCFFISQYDILNGNDKYQKEIKNLETMLKTAKENYETALKNDKQVQKACEEAEKNAEALAADMEKLEKQVQETDSERQALLKKVQKCKAAVEAADSEILEKKESLNAAARAVEDADTEIFRKKADIQDLIEAVKQSQQKLELAKQEFDKADKVGSDSRNKIKESTEKLQSLEEQKEKLTGGSKNSKSGGGAVQKSLKDRFQGLKSAFAKEERGYRV
jgi:DNA repair exonuclease SbcCD ATPase subunit